MLVEIGNFKYKLFDYYKQPRHYGGGGKNWNSAESLCSWMNCSYPYKTNNGTYHFVIDGDDLSIIGTGNVIGKDGSTNVRVTVKINGESKSIITTINN
ncbi:MAG: hypothetical protein DRJ01_14000 [Bacteroidetes bacterium]|nr:MAG: hypothetical protein DRJ01_14000 [Bacteroidota bacterium]